MTFASLFSDPDIQAEKRELPVVRALIERYTDKRPFQGRRIVFGHLLVRNSLPLIEALWRGGAEVIVCDAQRTPASGPVVESLARHGVRVWPASEAVGAADLFLDVAAALGRQRTPAGAAEVTRTGVLHYQHIPCPVVSADDTRAKLIEGFFGTGEGLLRAWRLFRPDQPLRGLACVQFGYGKIGRGVAQHVRRAGTRVVVADLDPKARARAEADGFPALDATPGPELQRALAEADVVISVTGRPGAMGRSIPSDWLRANRPALVNLGAEDEFGPDFADEEILGGRDVPLNFHLDPPTHNRYVDAPLAAHLLAMEALVRAQPPYPPGVHPLPADMDTWVVKAWRAAWPEEDLTGIREALGLPDV